MQPNTDNSVNENNANASPDDRSSIPNNTPTPPLAATPEPTPELAPTPAKSKKSKTTTIILACVLVLLAVGAAVAVGVILFQPQPNPDTAKDTDNSDDDSNKQETGESEMKVEEIGTAEVKDNKFTIKDESGKTIAADEETEINGIISCEKLEDDIRVSVRCVVSTAEGEGVYVYYTDDKILKFSESNN